MRAIREVTQQALRWSQPSTFKREYELRAGDEVLATLRWQKPFGSLALAESTDGTWTFKRSGFFSPNVTVRVPGSETEVAVFKPGWRGTEGTFRFSDGRCYQWLNTSFWSSEWIFAKEGGEPLIHFKPEFAFFKQAAEVKVEPGAVPVPDLSLLTVLGWYLLILLSEDSGAAAAGVMAGS
jgi:hypothetical protein